MQPINFSKPRWAGAMNLKFEKALFVFNSSLKSKLGIPTSVILQEKRIH